MTLDAWQWGNPETVLERKQELERRKIKGCTGCKHHKKMEVQGETLHRCEVGVFGRNKCIQFTTKGKYGN